MAMTMRDQVSVLIRSHSNTSFCDTCIWKEVGWGNRSMVNESTRYLARGRLVLCFSRCEGRCGVCGMTLPVIQFTVSPQVSP